jgi:hypothetical protein
MKRNSVAGIVAIVQGPLDRWSGFVDLLLSLYVKLRAAKDLGPRLVSMTNLFPSIQHFSCYPQFNFILSCLFKLR